LLNEAGQLIKLDRFEALLGVLAFLILTLHFGFQDYILPKQFVLIWTAVLPVGLFVVSLSRLLMVRNPWHYLVANPFRYIILLMILLELSGIAAWSSGLQYSSPSMIVSQVYLAIFLLASIGSWIQGLILANRWLSNRRIPVVALPAISFASVILAGALTLSMPGMQIMPVSFLDNLFTAASAVCVTGLTVYDIGKTLSPAGITVLAFLIQLGGIGTLTILGMLTLWAGGRLSIGEKAAFSDLLGGRHWQDTRKVIGMVLKVTVSIELTGAVILWYLWKDKVDHPILQGLFHSVSAFCNAGFSLFSNSLSNFSSDYLIIIVFILLITAGGLGFPVINNLWASGLSKLIPWRKSVPLNRTTRVVVISSLLLIIGGTLFLLLDGWITDKPRSIIPAIFQSVSLRTAGFQLESQRLFGNIGTVVSIILMAIGASPQSTGGGFKTTILARLFIKSELSQNDRPSRFIIFSKPFRLAVIIIAIYGSLGFAGGWLIMYLDKAAFMDALFESYSALGTVGLTRDLTSELTILSKLIVIMLMFTGRVLFPTLVTRLVRSRKNLSGGMEWA